uniref:Uncharacterized protein n=1 Tax=Rhizophora mucronata TaxID=61149 RepID=A0A2P2J419_RHIMU
MGETLCVQGWRHFCYKRKGHSYHVLAVSTAFSHLRCNIPR